MFFSFLTAVDSTFALVIKKKNVQINFIDGFNTPARP